MLGFALAALIAQEPDGLSAEMRSAHEAWAMCTGRAAYARTGGPETPAAVVDAALVQCQAEEAAMRKALRRQFRSASVDETIRTLRRTAHEELGRHVAEARARAAQRE